MISCCNQITVKINGTLNSIKESLKPATKQRVREEMGRRALGFGALQGPTNIRCGASNGVVVGKLGKISSSEAGIHLL